MAGSSQEAKLSLQDEQENLGSGRAGLPPESFPGGSESVCTSLSWTSRPGMVRFLLAR